MQSAYFSKNQVLAIGLMLLFIITGIAALYSTKYFLLCIPFVALALLGSAYSIEILFLLLIFLIPFSIESKVTKTLSTDFPDEPLMWLITGLLLLVILFKRNVRIELFSIKSPLFTMVCLSVLWIAITSFFSSNIIVSSKYLFSKLWYLCCFFFLPLLVFNKTIHLKRAFQFFAIGMLLIVLYAFLRHSHLNFSFLRINEAVRPFFRNHVNYSAVLAFMIPILFLGVRFTKNSRFRLLLSTVLLLCVGSLLLSYSRGAWLALLCCPIFYFFLKRKLLRQAMIGVFLLGLVSVLILSNSHSLERLKPTKEKTIYHTNFQDHLAATYEFTDMSFSERFYRWIGGVRMTAARPLFGFGPNTFYYNYKAYTLHDFKTWVSANREKSSIHNYYLLQFAEQGLMGGMIFLLILFIAFNKIEHLYHSLCKNERLYPLAIGFILTIICVELMVNDLIETDKVGSIFYLCLAGIIALDRISAQSNSTKTHDSDLKGG